MATSNKVKRTEFDFSDVIVISPSDTVNISADSTNNPAGYPSVSAAQVTVTGNFVFVVPNKNAGTTKNITVTGAPVGSIFAWPLLRVNATGTTGTVVGLIR